MGRKSNAPENPSTIPAHNFRGVRKRTCGRFVAEIQDKKTKFCLGIFDSPIAAARAYDRAAVALRGPKAKTNAAAIESLATGAGANILFLTPRPSMSGGSTVESSSEPSGPRRRSVNTNFVRQLNSKINPRLLGNEEDVRSDCGSSSSVVEDVDGGVESKRRRVLPFDLNLPPPMEGEDVWGSDVWLG